MLPQTAIAGRNLRPIPPDERETFDLGFDIELDGLKFGPTS